MKDESKAAAESSAAPETGHDWRPGRFMVIAAHPDDADFGPAATAARWIDEGAVGWLVCCTSGDQGGEDPAADPLELAALRER
jgi:LmbE family N-acetylglucosaminyl deacetylase